MVNILVIEYCNLEFVCILVLVIWDFIASHIHRKQLF